MEQMIEPSMALAVPRNTPPFKHKISGAGQLHRRLERFKRGAGLGSNRMIIST
jgi:hypothetical protein